jgi:DNA polymerase III epsilon subunit-like protein
MLKNLPYFVIDIETTGLDQSFCQILQLSAIYEDPSLQLSFEDIPKFNRYIKHDDYHGQDYALWLNSEILLRLSKYKNKWTKEEKEKSEIVTSYQRLFEDFDGWVRTVLGKQVPILGSNPEIIHINCAGKNFASFDLQFIKIALNQLHTPWENGYPIRFRHKILDPAILYVNDEDETLPGLEKCLERAGIKRELQKDGSIITHDALMDNWDVIQLFRKKY